jgi:predicted transcriptional regulator
LQNPVVLRARQKVLFYIYKRGRRYRANVSQVAKDLDLSDGNVNQYVNDLKRSGYLRTTPKGGTEYFRVTWKGQLSLYPLLLPRLLTLFVMVVGLAQILWAEPALLTGTWIVTPYTLLASGLILVGFAAVLLWAENRMDLYLIESKWSSGDQRTPSTG